MADRATLHLSKLDDFSAWMSQRGWLRVATKGVYEVLRLEFRGEEKRNPLVFYARHRATEHATIPYGPGAKLVRRYIRESR